MILKPQMSKRLTALLLLIFLLSTVHDAGSVLALNSEDGGVVRGTVIDQYGDPVVNTYLNFYHNDGTTYRGTYTDKLGRYSIHNVPIGEYEVVISPYLYEKRTIDLFVTHEDIELNIFMNKEKFGEILGVITDIHDAYITNASISFYRLDEYQNFERDVTTDKYGNYSIFLRTGDYKMVIWHNDYPYYHETYITIETDQIFENNLSIELNSGTISGTVTDIFGNPVSEVELFFEGKDSVVTPWTVTNSDGYYEIELHIGDYLIETYKDGYVWERLNFGLLNKDEHKTFDIALRKIGKVTGVVTNESGEPIADAIVELYGQDNSRFVSYTNDLGEFDILEIPYGNYDVYVSKGSLYESRNLQLSIASNMEELEIMIKKIPSSTILGIVTDSDGKPLTDTTLIFYEYYYSNEFDGIGGIQWRKDTKTDLDGKYQVDLAHGRYKIFVAKDSYFGRDIYVNLQDKDKNIDVVLQKGGFVEGRIKDRDGNPIKYAHISFRSEDGMYFNTTTNETGYYQTQLMSFGDYIVELYHPLIEDKVFEITLTQKRLELNKELIALPSGEISGSVTDTEGNPISDVYIAINKYGSNHNSSVTSLRTDSEGVFQVQLPAGEYYELEIYDYNGRFISQMIREIVITQGYSQVQNITLQAGGIVSGYITDEFGKPVYDAYIGFDEKDGTRYSATWTNNQGYFQTQPMHFTDYDISIHHYLYESKYAQLSLDQENVDYNYSLGKVEAGLVQGRIKTDNENILEGVSIVFRRRNSGEFVKQVFTNDKGEYRVEVPIGEYSIEAVTHVLEDGSYYTKKLEGIFIKSNEDKTIDLVLRKGGIIRGRIVDKNDNPVHMAQLIFACEEGEIYRASTDHEGFYDTWILPKTSYEVTVSHHLFNKQLTQVNLNDKSLEFNYKLNDKLDTGILSGKVTDLAGNPLRTHLLFRWKIDGEYYGIYNNTSLDGKYEVEVPYGDINMIAGSFMMEDKMWESSLWNQVKGINFHIDGIRIDSEDNLYDVILIQKEDITDGWIQIQDKWYLLGIDGVIQTGWQQSGGKWYLLGTNGEMQIGWAQSGGKWYLLGTNGVMQTGWVQSGGKWYLLGTNGEMQTGWVQSGGKWYLLGTNGVMQTGWVQSGGKWYLLGTNGVMQTGWAQSGGKWYLLGTNGVMQTGWAQSGGKWYFLEGNGVMVSGWRQISNNWYYFYSGGQMAANTTIGGYRLGASGAWIR